jgi:hypothetical protein
VQRKYVTYAMFNRKFLSGSDSTAFKRTRL